MKKVWTIFSVMMIVLLVAVNTLFIVQIQVRKSAIEDSSKTQLYLDEIKKNAQIDEIEDDLSDEELAGIVMLEVNKILLKEETSQISWGLSNSDRLKHLNLRRMLLTELFRQFPEIKENLIYAGAAAEIEKQMKEISEEIAKENDQGIAKNIFQFLIHLPTEVILILMVFLSSIIGTFLIDLKNAGGVRLISFGISVGMGFIFILVLVGGIRILFAEKVLEKVTLNEYTVCLFALISGMRAEKVLDTLMNSFSKHDKENVSN
jgi:hypothetical protein